MGVGDLLFNEINKMSEKIETEFKNQVDAIKSYPERQAELRQLQAEQAKMQRITLQINSGTQLVHATTASTMFQRQDGTIYFNSNYNDKFILIDYFWNGPMYETVTNSTANTTGQEVTKGKSGKMAAGAIIGTALIPGVGTAVGAAIGAGGKKKKNKSLQSNTSSIQRQTEILTPATLKFKNMDTNNIVSIVIGCNSLIDSQIKGLQIYREQSTQELSKDTTDALKGIKALKELLDMGAITQEEFDMKKQQLLQQ